MLAALAMPKLSCNTLCGEGGPVFLCAELKVVSGGAICIKTDGYATACLRAAPKSQAASRTVPSESLKVRLLPWREQFFYG